MSQTNEKNSYLLCEEDGLLMRRSGAWASEKLDYLNRYLNIFTNSMYNKKWRSLNFIDLFSGPGKCQIDGTNQILLGSPLLALSQVHPFDQYFFVDSDQTAIDALKIRCSSSNQAANVQYFIGDCNKEVIKIIQQIKAIDRKFIEDKWLSLNLAFLYPQGFQLEWNTVKILGEVKKMDLLIYYPQMGLTREMPKDIQNSGITKIDIFFGDTRWRNIYQQYQSRKIQNINRQLLDLYENNLKSLGYIEIKENEPLMKNKDRNAPLYRLIFASKNPMGKKF